MNNTRRVIDMIPKDIVIRDWHYNRPESTPAYFALKGFRVIRCCWNKPGVARDHVRLMRQLREFSIPEVSSRLLGSSPDSMEPCRSLYLFVKNPIENPDTMGPVNSYRALFENSGND